MSEHEHIWLWIEDLPSAMVYACLCGEHRVRQLDPDAHQASMAALADALIARADDITD